MLNYSTFKNQIKLFLPMFSLCLCMSIFLSFCKNEESKNTSTNVMNIDSNLSPLDKLKAGNQRFIAGNLIHPDQTKQRLHEIAKKQQPFVTLVSCSDSRISPELIFDQGLGDIFTIRTAGNVIGDFELGSIEYAVTHVNTKLIVVMGHQNCGAISAYLDPASHRIHKHIIEIINYISKEREEKLLPDSVKYEINYAVNANIKHGVNLLKNSLPILKPLVDSGKLMVIGALYSLENGSVTFFE